MPIIKLTRTHTRHLPPLLERDRDEALALSNLGGIHLAAGRAALAVSCYERAIGLRPQLHMVREYLAHALLLAGDFARGWKAYEYRRFHDISGLSVSVPRWNTDPADGGSLILVSEQGLGDAIQFVRYGALLNRAGVTASLECDARMVSLLRSCGYFRDVMSFGSGTIQAQTRWFPLLSLPLTFSTLLQTIPTKVPYLRADPQRVALWRERLQTDGFFKIGIAWQGNPKAERETLRGRSVPLAHFAPLAAIPNVRLFSLQRFDGVEQLDRTDFAASICVPAPPLDAGDQAFLDTAALMTQLDLVITSDTSIAHLAGALGRPVWVALKHAPDWRWLLARSDSPWYPSMRLFRQPAPQRWAPVFEDMAQCLREIVAFSRDD